MKILLASSIDPRTIERLGIDHELVYAFAASEDRLTESIVDCQALIFRSGVQISGRVLAAANSLELIIRAGSGYDNIDLDQLATMKVRFVRVPGPGALAVAELSFTMMLALARNLLWADSSWKAGHWVKSQASGRLMTGRRLGIVGAGNIGRRTGELGTGWGMDVIGCVEHPTDQARQRLTQSGIRLTDLEEVLSTSDFISVHVPLQDSTRNLIDTHAISKMKPGVFLVNLARGGVVDESALAEALRAGHVAGAGLDVHAVEGEGNIPPLATIPNVILTPHIGASTVDSQAKIGTTIVSCINQVLTNPPTDLATQDHFVVM